MNILLVGGAGYIGSHMLKRLLQGGAEVTTLDNLSTGYEDAVLGGKFVRGDLADNDLLNRLLREHSFDAVMQFASCIQVGESMKDPSKYYRNNVANTLNLLEAMRKAGTTRFVFSSTAAIFGQPMYTPIDEEHPQLPINPYGHSKQMVEQILTDFSAAYDLNSVTLRYFNAAGADPDGELGERHEPETHLIPLVLQAASGRRPNVRVFGDDYKTPDGTCIRDYVHVTDLVEAHWLTLEYLMDGGPSRAYNLGNGQGFSVKEVIDTAQRLTSREIPVVMAARREGDPAVLLADSRRARSELGWQPKLNVLDDIIRTAWEWETRPTPANYRGFSTKSALTNHSSQPEPPKNWRN